ncbi:putative RNA lariat debranching enzyme [Aspergillus flavus]|nr:putative RNA lariat debranching enzyme [Aspergillus flavus]
MSARSTRSRNKAEIENQVAQKLGELGSLLYHFAAAYTGKDRHAFADKIRHSVGKPEIEKQVAQKFGDWVPSSIAKTHKIFADFQHIRFEVSIVRSLSYAAPKRYQGRWPSKLPCNGHEDKCAPVLEGVTSTLCGGLRRQYSKCCEKNHEQGKRCPNTLHTGTFARLTQPYDPAIPITTEQIPPEYNNPQTAQFCELTDIENRFHLSNEEREARIAAGPRPVESRQNFSRHSRRYGGYGGYGLYIVEGAVEMGKAKIEAETARRLRELGLLLYIYAIAYAAATNTNDTNAVVAHLGELGDFLQVYARGFAAAKQQSEKEKNKAKGCLRPTPDPDAPKSMTKWAKRHRRRRAAKQEKKEKKKEEEEEAEKKAEEKEEEEIMEGAVDFGLTEWISAALPNFQSLLLFHSRRKSRPCLARRQYLRKGLS